MNEIVLARHCSDWPPVEAKGGLGAGAGGRNMQRGFRFGGSDVVTYKLVKQQIQRNVSWFPGLYVNEQFRYSQKVVERAVNRNILDYEIQEYTKWYYEARC